MANKRKNLKKKPRSINKLISLLTKECKVVLHPEVFSENIVVQSAQKQTKKKSREVAKKIK